MSDNDIEKSLRVPVNVQKDLATREDIQADISTILKQIELYKMKIKSLRVRIRALKARKTAPAMSNLGSASTGHVAAVPKSVFDLTFNERGEIENGDAYEEGKPD